MQVAKFWQTSIHCARCDKAEFVEQPGQQPVGWVIVACTESKFDPRQPQAQPQPVLVPYPFCSLTCAAQFTLMRAWGGLHTREAQEDFKNALLSIKWFEEAFEG